MDPITYSAGGRRKRHIEIEEAAKEIKLQAFGEEIHLQLEENTQLVADGLEVEIYGEDGVQKVPLTTKNCFYHGKVASQEGSKVAVSTCDGVVSYSINLSTGSRSIVCFLSYQKFPLTLNLILTLLFKTFRFIF